MPDSDEATRDEDVCGHWMRRQQAYCARKPHSTGRHSSAGDPVPPEVQGDLCGYWIPRKQAACARKPLHRGDHRPAESMADTRPRKTERRVGLRASADPAARARWNRTYRLSQYGLTPETFARMLEAQGYACAMGGEPFEDGDPICIDHDHACCPDEKQSCGRCLRGLLCRDCNTALGHIERKGELSRAYLNISPAQRVNQAV